MLILKQIITNPTILILTSILIIIYLNNPISITNVLIKVVFLFLCYYLYKSYYENPNKFIKQKYPLKINKKNEYFKGLRYDKALETLINKYNYWYQKALKNPKDLDENVYRQYFDNAYLYYSEIINRCHHILNRGSPSEIHNINSYRSIRQYMSNLESEINNLRALIINNNNIHKFNNNALNRMAVANDMYDYLYSANYTVN